MLFSFHKTHILKSFFLNQSLQTICFLKFKYCINILNIIYVNITNNDCLSILHHTYSMFLIILYKYFDISDII